MTRDRARREVKITLAGAARIALAGAIGAFLETIIGPPVRWGLLLLAMAFGLGAMAATHHRSDRPTGG